MKKIISKTVGLAAASLCIFSSGNALAIDVPVYNYDVASFYGSAGCAVYGDAISCSAQYLNYLAYGNVDGMGNGQNTTSYVVSSAEGTLKPAIVVFTGDQANASNTDLKVGTNVDNAYVGSGAGGVTTYGTSTDAGEKVGNNLIDPTTVVVGEVAGAVGNNTAWDISLNTLISNLTIDGVRRDMLFMFDNNQAGSGLAQQIDASALVCVRDSTGTNAAKCYELVDPNGTANINVFGQNYMAALAAFETQKTYGDTLSTTLNANSESAVVANATICVSTTTKLPVAFNVGQCPAGSVLINNNLGTQESEFIVSVPELNALLEWYATHGYDSMSVQFLFSGNTNGFENIFIMAGQGRLQVPEPGMLGLMGLALVGAGIVRLRKFS